jgi:hypothetical protein
MRKEIILQPEIKYIVVDFTKPVVTDDPNNKVVIAKFNLIADNNTQYDYPPLIVWSESDYDTAGQWTDTDLHNRIEFLLTQ